MWGPPWPAPPTCPSSTTWHQPCRSPPPPSVSPRAGAWQLMSRPWGPSPQPQPQKPPGLPVALPKSRALQWRAPTSARCTSSWCCPHRLGPLSPLGGPRLGDLAARTKAQSLAFLGPSPRSQWPTSAHFPPGPQLPGPGPRRPLCPSRAPASRPRGPERSAAGSWCLWSPPAARRDPGLTGQPLRRPTLGTWRSPPRLSLLLSRSAASKGPRRRTPTLALSPKSRPSLGSAAGRASGSS